MQLTDTITKNYFFPTFYGDDTTAVAMFYCSQAKARALMPDPSMVPVDMGFERSLVIFTSYRYNRVFGIQPYNEIAISIPVVAGRNFTPPILPLLLSDFKGLGFYVLSMPVTTEENNIRGHKLWGLPKVVQEIDLTVDQTDYVTTAKEPTGETYLEFRVPMRGSPLQVDSQTFLYSRLNDEIVRSASHAKGDFVTTKFLASLAIPNQKHNRVYLTVADTPAGKVLKNLEIAPQPFQMRFSKGTEATFDLPDGEFKIRLAPPSKG